MTFDTIIKSIQERKFSPLYLLHGEETFFIDLIMEKLQNSILTDQEKEFNQMVFYGKDANPQNIVSSARQYPMMAEYRVILLKEAQQMKGLDTISSYLENPVSSTIMVISYKGKKMDMRTSLAKAIKKNGTIFESSKLYENKVPAWIKNHAKSLGINITDNASGLMTALLGTDLSKIDNELQKLKIAIDPEKPVDIAEIKNNIGLSREYNVYELNNALGQMDTTKIFRIIDIFETNPKQYPLTFIIITLYGYFTKVLIVSENIRKSDMELKTLIGVNPYFIKAYKSAARIFSRKKLYEIFDILKDYDMRSKGVGVRSVTQIEMIKEMIIKIIS